MEKEVFINEKLRRELICSTGCTEPSAIAYAVSYAKEQIQDDDEIKKIELMASSNIIKNALCVTLPNTNVNGIMMIILLAVLKCKSRNKLNILNHISQKDISDVEKIRDKIEVNVSLKEHVNPLFIEVNMYTKNDHKVNVIVEQYHDKIRSCSIDDKVLFDNSYEIISTLEDIDLNFDDIYRVIKEKKYDKDLIEKVRKCNYEVGKFGLNNKVGLNIGAAIGNLKMYDDKVSKVISTTVAAIDSRMSGVPIKVYINSGSGNQGLTATIPIVEFAKQYNISNDLELDALALSHLVALYIRSKQRRLSSSCGAICAAAGVTAGISYLLGCNKRQTEGAINNVLCSSFGVFCDGAKNTCSLKVASAISCAINSAMLAKNDVLINDNYGVISSSVDETLSSLSIIENALTENMDKIIMNQAIKMKKKPYDSN